MSNLRLTFSVFGKYLVCLLMCFFVTFSFIAIFSMLTLDMVGYEAAVFETEESEEPIEQYVHYYADGDDVKKADYEAKEYIVVTREFAGEFGGGAYVASHLISQIVSLVLFVVIVPSALNKQGQADRNAVACGRAKKDILKGLKTSLLTTAVSLASFVCLILSKLGIMAGGLSIYSFANYHLFGYQKLIFGSVTSAEQIGWVGIALAFLPVLLTPAVCAVTYILGYKDISLYEKAVYKKQK